MALTATATNITRRFIIKSLNMQSPEIIYIPPARDNIIYRVMEKPKSGVYEVFRPIIERLKKERSNMGRIIIFCKTYTSVISIYMFFKKELVEYITEPKGYPDFIVYRVMDMYTHCTHETVKNKLITQFMKTSPLRVIIATI